MDDSSSQSGAAPDTTLEGSNERGRAENQPASQHVGLSRRSALTSLLGIGGLSLGLAGPAAARQSDAGRYLTVDQGTYDFTGPAEWANAGDFTNTASGPKSVVGGGETNEASGEDATVSGGKNNTASDIGATVCGGEDNAASNSDAAIGGGSENEASGITATVGGGLFNTASGAESVVGGGLRNTASDNWTTVSGGEYNTASAFRATVGGGEENTAKDTWATVAGGQDNVASAFRAFVGAGRNNEASDTGAAVAGGENNTASGFAAAVGGGTDHTASGTRSTVGGGENNDASGDIATVGGGKNNEASGRRATVPGGAGNIADGDYSVAVGREAVTNNHDGAVVFGDSSWNTFGAQNDDEVRSQMPMYAPSFNSTSARSAKTAINPVDSEAVLAGVESLAVTTWELTDRDDGRHIGPMAGEFHETFGLGDDEETIATVDADGVALAAIQGLSQQIDADQERIDELSRENEQLRERLATVEDRLNDLETAETSPAPDID